MHRKWNAHSECRNWRLKHAAAGEGRRKEEDAVGEKLKHAAAREGGRKEEDAAGKRGGTCHRKLKHAAAHLLEIEARCRRGSRNKTVLRQCRRRGRGKKPYMGAGNFFKKGKKWSYTAMQLTAWDTFRWPHLVRHWFGQKWPTCGWPHAGFFRCVAAASVPHTHAHACHIDACVCATFLHAGYIGLNNIKVQH